MNQKELATLQKSVSTLINTATKTLDDFNIQKAQASFELEKSGEKFIKAAKAIRSARRTTRRVKNTEPKPKPRTRRSRADQPNLSKDAPINGWVHYIDPNAPTEERDRAIMHNKLMIGRWKNTVGNKLLAEKKETVTDICHQINGLVSLLGQVVSA